MIPPHAPHESMGKDAAGDERHERKHEAAPADARQALCLIRQIQRAAIVLLRELGARLLQ